VEGLDPPRGYSHSHFELGDFGPVGDKLLLFDIDGTLISGSRAGQSAYLEAIKACYDLDVDLENYSTAGKTDLLIMKELLEKEGIPPKDIDLNHLSYIYLQSLRAAVLHDPGSVLPGVAALLEQLTRRPEIYLGLGTGNLEEAAAIKLRFHKLDKYFQTGGFGSDALERSDLIREGIRKASTFFRVRFQDVVVVGDTPFDIEAAEANGVFCIAVASGPFTIEDLTKFGATKVLPDLRQSNEFLAALYSFQ
jgi:beta-phosphoglucomutase-like phosphatase (HAD superfamily)